MLERGGETLSDLCSRVCSLVRAHPDAPTPPSFLPLPLPLPVPAAHTPLILPSPTCTTVSDRPQDGLWTSPQPKAKRNPRMSIMPPMPLQGKAVPRRQSVLAQYQVGEGAAQGEGWVRERPRGRDGDRKSVV